jgi:gamma-glutamylcyclotransferase (GGCT)/AIG2-like uncharacterized protein YtfP
MKKTDNEIYLRLFVYGTLKRGFWNHARFCSQAVSIEPATTCGESLFLRKLVLAFGANVPTPCWVGTR